jgi:hypothetical protein
MKKHSPCYFCCLLAILTLIPIQVSAKKKDDSISMETIEMAPFVVYGGLIDTYDGFSGKPYTESNAVVEGFREDFNDILKGYHRRILIEELEHMKKQLAISTRMSVDMEELCKSFGIDRFKRKQPESLMPIEKAITMRLLKDPFFIIEGLVVWDLDRLKARNGNRPRSKFSNDIRYNPETEEWERRVTTKWEASIWPRNSNNEIHVIKEQGLNLDSNTGFHLINRGLTGQVTPRSFHDVKLTYPIFVNSTEPVAEQVQKLKDTLLANLTHIYDPYSWAMRRNVRFRGGYLKELMRHTALADFKLSEREWFDPLLAHFLNDNIITKYFGPNEIYAHLALQKTPVNTNILGEKFDLLNWNDGEERSVKYNPKKQWGFNTNFDHPDGARFILFDAYRRYQDKFVDALRTNLELANAEKGETSAKELVKRTLSEVSDVPADIYIKKASKVQRDLLNQYKIDLSDITP